MKKYPLLKLVCCVCLMLNVKAATAQDINVQSPNGKLKVTVSLTDQILFTLTAGNQQLLKPSVVALQLSDGTLGDKPRLISKKLTSLKGELKPLVPLKFSTIKNDYNLLNLDFKGEYSLQVRAYDEGFAYRFITRKKGEIEVVSEQLELRFPEEYQLDLQQTRGFKTAYEESYSHMSSTKWATQNRMSTLPVLINAKDQYKILLSESDVEDYPAMFVKGKSENGIAAVFPKAPLTFGDQGDRSVEILKEADYIAKTKGNRTFPWRYFVVTENDGQLLTNTMTAKLAAPSAIQQTNWIQPGQVSWEWWNDASPYGPDVDFVSGYNLNTYKYYIDFAAKQGMKYIIMDEGWAKDTRNPFEPNPEVDVHELIAYGKKKNVGIVLWLTWLTVEKNFDLFKKFSDWGVKGIKIDFMDRSDQWMVNYYERVAKEAANHKLFVDFHGSFKPAGLEYKYPNVLSYEGVRGMEQMGGATPDNSLYLPFMRNAVGPMDYTPGAMISMQPEVYSAQRPNSGSIGTRAYQMALFVVFESGLQMLADNPTMYYKNQDCTDFITSVPTTWDETVPLAAKAGEYAVVAKRKGDKWFIGGMTNSKMERVLELRLPFLKPGQSYKMISFEDGINAGRQAMDYRKKETIVKAADTLRIKMVRNGGWAAVLN